MTRRTCLNCRATTYTSLPRWCDDCWRMAAKTLASTIAASVGVWLCAHWLTIVRAVGGAVFNR